MSVVESVRVGDEGTVFAVSLTDAGVVVDPSAATVKEIRFKKTDGTQVYKTASVAGTDLEWPSEAGFFAAADVGTWYFWGYIETAAGGKWSSDPQRFRLKPEGSV